MKILLLGYGKMGQAVEKIALERGHQIIGKITSANRESLNQNEVDAAIEFSKPEAAYENVRWCIEHRIPVACGTTGWLTRKPELEKMTLDCNGTFFYASNFSIGVNIFFRLNEQLAEMIGTFNQYNVSIDEIHHTEKKDSPSGTAITLAQGIMKFLKNKKSWVNRDTQNKEEISIQSFRIAEVPGTHVVKYDSLIDSLEIRHVAHSREGFARGAVMVAEWLRGKKGVLGMSDFLKF